MPFAIAGREIRIVNNGDRKLQIFSDTGDNLGAGINISVSLAARSSVTYWAYDALNWTKA